MDTLLIIFIGIFVFAFFATIVFNIFHTKAREKQKNEHFSKEKLKEYEKILEDYLEKNGIKEKDINAVLKHIGCNIEEKYDMQSDHEAYYENNTIYVDKSLGYRVKNFGIAHEVAHIIRGTEESAARDPHSFRKRSLEEQICDYIAAALLLPLGEIGERLNKAKYNEISKREKFRFISALAEEKNVCEEVVIRRIEEIQLING